MAVYNLPNYVAANGFGMPLNIRRGNPDPLDNSSVWASLDAAKNYAKTDPVAYVGQILSVVDNANGIVDVYKINNTAGDLVLVGTVTLGDDKSIVKNDDDTLSLYDFGKKYYKFVAAEGDVAAHYEVAEGWKNGLEPKVRDGVLAWYEPNPTTVDGLQSAINGLQEEFDTANITVKANAEAIKILNGDETTEGSVAYQIAAVVAGANADFDTLKEIADWIAAHPNSVAAINKAIQDNANAIRDLALLVGEDSVEAQITAAIGELNISQYATAEALEDAIEDIGDNALAIKDLQDLVGEGTVDERINAAVKETVDGIEKDKFALREHNHAVSDVDGLGARLDALATKDTVSGIDGRVQAIEKGLGTTIDAAIQTHVAAADLKYETIENVSILSGQIDIKIAALEKADTDNLTAAKDYADAEIAKLNIGQYVKQEDFDTVIDDIQNHETVNSFADVMEEIAKKQDTIPENTYDAYGAAAAVSGELATYKTEANARLKALEDVDNATQQELDDAVLALGQADASILAKIGAVADGENLVDLIAAAQNDVDDLEILVGTVPEGSDTVISYIDKKAEEVLNAVVGDSDETVESVSAALDDYKTENDQKVEAAAGAAASAQSKANEAYELAGTKATMAEVNAAIANAGHAVATEVEAAFDGINVKIGEVPEGSTVMAEIVKAQEAATYDDTDVVNKLNTLIDTDVNKSVRAIAAEELAAQLIPANAAEALNTLQEIATWIQEHPEDASDMNDAILALKNKVDTGEKKVSAYVADAIDAIGIDDYATSQALTNAINAEISRANDAYAGKSYEGTVDSHTKDTDIHVTTEDKAKWNSAQANAEKTAGEALAQARTQITSEIGTAKGEAITAAGGLADSAKSAAVSEATGMVNAAKGELDLAIKGITDDIEKINGDENTEGSFAKADAAVLASAQGYADNKIEELLQWGEF